MPYFCGLKHKASLAESRSLRIIEAVLDKVVNGDPEELVPSWENMEELEDYLHDLYFAVDCLQLHFADMGRERGFKQFFLEQPLNRVDFESLSHLPFSFYKKAISEIGWFSVDHTEKATQGSSRSSSLMM